jgi:hypothetical protein
MEIKDLPHINEKKDYWKAAIQKLDFNQRLIIKKRLEYLLSITMAANTSISVKEQKDLMFKADKLRKNFDITKLPADKLNRYQRSQLVNIKQEHPDLEIESL